MRVASYPASGGVNPYLSLFYGAMAAHGVYWDGGFEPEPSWLARAGRSVGAIHFHWGLENIWRPNRRVRGGLFTRLRARDDGESGFAKFLGEARARGLRVLWTCHDLEPHETSGPQDRRGYAAVARAADLIICHSEAAAVGCLQRYGPTGSVVVVPHGSFVPAFPAPRDRATIRAELGIGAQDHLLVCLGYVRRYKGFDLACRAMQHLPANTHLLVAGAEKRLDAGEFAREVDAAPRSRWLRRRLADQEYVDLARAADVVLLPYRDAGCSGALVSAADFGSGVVASDIPIFRELVCAAPQAGRLFASGDPADLAGAVLDLLRVPRSERLAGLAALRADWTWERAAARTSAAMATMLADADPLEAAKP